MKFKKITAALLALLMIAVLGVNAFALERDDEGVYFQSAKYGISATMTVENAPETYQGGDYTVVVKAADNETPAFENEVITAKIGESMEWSGEEDKPAMYSYLVYQQAGQDENIEYDDTVYRVEIDISTNDEGLVKSVESILNTKTGEKVEKIVFANTYIAPDAPEKPTKPETTKPETTKPETKPAPAPATGDITNDTIRLIVLGVLGMAIIAVAICYVIVKKRGKEEKKKADK